MSGKVQMEAAVYSVSSITLSAQGQGDPHEALAITLRELVIDFASWLSEQAVLDVATPDEAVDLWLAES